MVLSTGALLTLIDANAKVQANYTHFTNLSFVIDSISRNVRTGNTFFCSNTITYTPEKGDTKKQKCTTGGKYLEFTRERLSDRVAYRLKDGAIEQYVSKGVNMNTGWQPLTTSEMQISNLNFIVNDTTPGNNSQPEISILVQGTMNNGLDVPTAFTLQTRVTQRLLDY